jgi:hypothetical protein
LIAGRPLPIFAKAGGSAGADAMRPMAADGGKSVKTVAAQAVLCILAAAADIRVSLRTLFVQHP